MVSFVRLTILVSLFLSVVTFAESMKLYVWSPTGSKARLIIPVKTGQTPQGVARDYLATVTSLPDLKKITTHPWLTSPQGRFSEFNPTGVKPPFALMDNIFTDTEIPASSFRAAGADTYVIPLGAELVLSTDKEKKTFRHLIAKNFAGLVALGGPDIEPSLYNERNTYSKDPNLTRDMFEVELIEAYKSHGTGLLFGICRGHQLISTTEGYRLIQDLPKETGVRIHRGSDADPMTEHDIQLVDGGSSLLRSILGGAGSARVNSLHHQAVDPNSSNCSKDMKIVATAGKGSKAVVEAIESKDGRILTVQFHPEGMYNATGNQIMSGVVKAASKLYYGN